MSNPTIPWQLMQLDPDTDAPKLMQDFEAILDWMVVEAIHRHHFQFNSFDIPGLAAGGSADVTGISFVEPFPASVVPLVFCQQNATGAATAGIVQVVFFPYNITNAGCDVRMNNPGGAVVTALPSGGKLMAVDATWNVSL